MYRTEHQNPRILLHATLQPPPNVFLLAKIFSISFGFVSSIHQPGVTVETRRKKKEAESSVPLFLHFMRIHPPPHTYTHIPHLLSLSLSLSLGQLVEPGKQNKRYSTFDRYPTIVEGSKEGPSNNATRNAKKKKTNTTTSSHSEGSFDEYQQRHHHLQDEFIIFVFIVLDSSTYSKTKSQ